MWPVMKRVLVSCVTVTPSDTAVENTEKNINGAVRSIHTTIIGWSDGLFLIIHI